jgi:DNA-directed RNA polymerase beta' subunit
MVEFLDQLKEVSFEYATRSGISISPFELEEIISDKEKVLAKAEKEAQKIANHFAQGFYNEEERKQKKIAV